MEPVPVVIKSSDPITVAGLANYLRPHDDVEVQSAPDARTGLLVVALGRITAPNLHKLTSDVPSRLPMVLVVDSMSHEELLIAIDAGAVAVLPRAAVTQERLHRTVVVTASGGGVMPADLLGGLLRHFERLQREILIPHGYSGAGFTDRELEVLRMMADGLDTSEIADKMSYSERTIKAVVSAAAKRLNLRNRTHVIAYACRSGVI